jgi:hypothetical protein
MAEAARQGYTGSWNSGLQGRQREERRVVGQHQLPCSRIQLDGGDTIISPSVLRSRSAQVVQSSISRKRIGSRASGWP